VLCRLCEHLFVFINTPIIEEKNELATSLCKQKKFLDREKKGEKNKFLCLWEWFSTYIISPLIIILLMTCGRLMLIYLTKTKNYLNS
jgi:hypothetical protein